MSPEPPSQASDRELLDRAVALALAAEERGHLPIAAVIALTIGFGTHFVFTRFMYIDLPQ